MKKFPAILWILLAALVFYVVFNLIPHFYFNLGKIAYDGKDYINARKFLKTAVFFNRKNKDARYYYVKTLTNLKPTLDIQRELFKISQQNLADSADLIADRQIAKWRNLILFNTGENYIQQVPYDDAILRWDADSFPLKVNIENDSKKELPEYYSTDFKKAFQQWQKSTGGFINFEFVDSANDANIIVKIVPSSEAQNCKGEDCKYIIGQTTPIIQGNLLKKMEIVFYDSDNNGKPFSQLVIYNTALHEIGHALGIMGHSYNKEDLMYMENVADNDLGKAQSDLQLISTVDLNTLSLLYKLIPEITNTPMKEFDTSRQFYAPIVMGSDTQINSREIIEARNYIQAAPNLPNGYINLASALANEKEYNESLEALLKALSLSSNDSEKYIAYYNLAVVYMQIQDWENSLKYANLAKAIKSDSEIEGLIAGINFNRGNSSFAKQAYINAVEKNPGNEIDAVNLARIYLREFNFVQVGKTLNRLVEANPEARNNPNVKSLGFFMMLFK